MEVSEKENTLTLSARELSVLGQVVGIAARTFRLSEGEEKICHSFSHLAMFHNRHDGGGNMVNDSQAATGSDIGQSPRSRSILS